ncbi:hypothetical protein Q7C36_010689 [Tachysurus vachellii]|uniref:Uncharacterized protein n=1 Tax=Tachysurus vachellii TaxID=175792 RepID=A0AA88MZD8_TACVA|nr:hypothetical protein Q7C36_010687 [Tachysurus vachellii]KAK2845835.1 hypothetical protein Q7C36_010689 [Tachysurus vachellii]
MFDLLISHGIEEKMLNKDYKYEGKRLGFKNRDFKFIHELIEGPPLSRSSAQWPYRGRTQAKSYLYEIVANKLTGIDVDKMDYISRDCLHLGMKSNFSHKRFMMFARVCCNEDESKKHICMRDKEAINMYELFHSRYMLHYTVCHHRVKVAIETMITDALVAAEGHFKLGDKTISEAVLDPETFVKLTDDIIMNIMQSTNPDLKNSRKIIMRIRKRELYKFVGSKIFQTKEIHHLKTAQKMAAVQDWLQYIKTTSENTRLKRWQKWINQKTEADFTVKFVELNYGKKAEDPIKYLQFYRKNKPNKSVKLDYNEVSYMTPVNFSETKGMIFYKGLGKVPRNLPLKPLWEILRARSSEDSDEETSEESDEETSEDSDKEASGDLHEEEGVDLHEEASGDLDEQASGDLDEETSGDLDEETSGDLHKEASGDLDEEASENNEV